MSKSYCPATHPIFDESISINVPDLATLTSNQMAGTQLGILIVALSVGVATPGDDLMNSLLKFSRLSEFHTSMPAGGIDRSLGVAGGETSPRDAMRP